MPTTSTTIVPPMIFDHRSYVHNPTAATVAGLLVAGVMVGVVLSLVVVFTLDAIRARR